MIQCHEAFKGTLACKDVRGPQLPLAGTAEQQPPHWPWEEATIHCPHHPVQRDAAGPNAKAKTQGNSCFQVIYLLPEILHDLSECQSKWTNHIFNVLLICLIDCQERNFKGSTSLSGERVTFCSVFHVSKMQIYKGLGVFIQNLNFNIPQASKF